MNTPIKVLHVLWQPQFGGAERVVRDILVYVDESSFIQAVCFLSDCGSPDALNWFKKHTVFQLRMKTGLSLKEGLKFESILTDFLPDIVVLHKPNPLVAFLLSMHKRILKIYFEHGADLLKNHPFKEIYFYKLFSGLFQRVVANSENVKERLVNLGLCNKDFIVTYRLGLDSGTYCSAKSTARRMLDLSDCVPVVGVVARLTYQKGVDDFIRTAELIQLERPDVIFIIVGDGPMLYELKELALQLGVKVRFLGGRSDVNVLLSSFDLFIVTAREESFGLVILEAFASGVPVIGFETSGALEINRIGGGGIFLPSRDMALLAQYALKLLGDERLREEMIIMGRNNLIRNFDIRRNIRFIEDIFRNS